MSKELVNILYLSHGGGLGGGAEICFYETSLALSKAGFVVHALFSASGELLEKVKPIVAETHVISYRSWVGWPPVKGRQIVANTYHNVRATVRIISLIKNKKIDLVITNTLVSPVGAWAAKLGNTPHVWYIHEFGDIDHGFYYHYGKKLSLRSVDWFSNRVVVNSRTVMNYFLQYVNKSKLLVNYYVIEVSAVCPEVTDGVANNINIAMMGRITPGKRQEDAIRAVAILAQSRIPTHLLLIGLHDESYSVYLKNLTKELDIESIVDFVNFTPDPFSLLNGCDVLLACSRMEAFGRVIIEGMKLKKTVVASNAGAFAELIQSGENGLLYLYANAEDLAEKLAYLYHHPEEKND